MPVVAVRLTSPGYFQHGAHSDARRPRLRPTRTASAGRAVVIVSENTAQAVLAGPESARQAHHADDDDEGAGRSRRRGARGQDRDRSTPSEADSETAIYAPAAQFAFNGSALAVRTTSGSAQPDARDGRRDSRPSIPSSRCSTSRRSRKWWRSRSGSGRSRCCCWRRSRRSRWCWRRSASTACWPTRCASACARSASAWRSARRRAGFLRLVVIEGLKPTLIGVALGLVLAAAVGARDGDAALRREPARPPGRSAPWP